MKSEKLKTNSDKEKKRTVRVQLWLLLAVAALVWGCPDDPQPPEPVRSFRVVEAPEFMLANIDSSYRFIVQVEGEGAAADSIQCNVYLPNGQLSSSFALLDDGGLFPVWGPEYAGTQSFDIVPNDLRFTRKINGRILANGVTGAYRLEFLPRGNFAPQPVELTVHVEAIQECLIRTATDVNALAECFAEFDVRATVIADAPDVVDSVMFQILDGGDVMAELELARVSGDTLWGASIAPPFLRCVPTGGNYSYAYVAKSRFGLSCAYSDDTLAIFNQLPILSNSTLPDTIYRPVAMGDTDTVIVTVDLEDCELAGATDFYGLQFESRREDLPDWGRASDFYLRDDGVTPDIVAGNGVYTVGLTFVRNDARPNSVYYFRYYAIEGFLAGCVPFDTSGYLLDSVRVIQPGVVAGGGGVAGEADFGIVNGRR